MHICIIHYPNCSDHIFVFAESKIKILKDIYWVDFMSLSFEKHTFANRLITLNQDSAFDYFSKLVLGKKEILSFKKVILRFSRTRSFQTQPTVLMTYCKSAVRSIFRHLLHKAHESLYIIYI